MLKRTSEDKPRRKFQERELTEDNYKERAEQSTGIIGDQAFKKGFDTYRAKQGENCIRILPPTWDNPNHYGHDVYVHSFVGVSRGSYLCLSKMKNKRCPICEAANEAASSGEESESKKLAVKRRVVYWVLDRNAEGGKKPWPMLFSASPTMDRDIAACTRTKRGQVYIHRKNDGRDVIFKRKGATLTNTEYFGYQLDTEPTAVSDDRKIQDAILDFIEENPIPSTFLFQTPEYLKEVMEGTVEEEDQDLDTTDDSEDEEAAEYKASKKRQKEDTYGADEDEDKDERPAKTKSKSKAKPAEDDEDDEEEDAPWEEDEEAETESDSDDEDYTDETGDDDDEPEAKSPKRVPISKNKKR